MSLLTWQILVLFVIVFILFAVAIIFLIYHRVFKKVKVKKGGFRPLNFVYSFHQGDYQKNMMIMEKILDKVHQAKIPVVSAATIYYDNPRKTRRSELRSDVGLIVPDSVSQTQIPDFSIKTIDHAEYIYTAFPYVSRFSVVLGAMKVYPAFKKWLKKHHLQEKEIIEIYEMQHKTIIYLMPIDNNS